MKSFLVLFLLFSNLIGFTQSTDLAAFGGIYLSNRNTNRINQESGNHFGFELTRNFSEKSKITFRANYGTSKFFEEGFNSLLNQTTPTEGTNTETTDVNIALLYGRDILLHEKFKINTAAGISLIVFDYYSNNNLEIRNNNTQALELIQLTRRDSEAYGFPLSLGAEYQPTNNWSFHLESGITLEPDYGMMSLYLGPKVCFRLD